MAFFIKKEPGYGGAISGFAADEKLVKHYCKVLEVVSSSVTSMGWKRYSSGESSEINYNYRFDLYIRRRKLSDLVSQNDDI